MSGTNGPAKDEVLAAIAREREAWDALLAEVGEARMAEPGAMGDWTFKELVVHLNCWYDHTLRRLEAEAKGQPAPAAAWPDALSEDDEINAWFNDAHRERSPADVVAESRDAFSRLEAVVAALPEEALADPDRFPGMEGQALGPEIVSAAYFLHLHEDHEPDVRRWLAASR